MSKEIIEKGVQEAYDILAKQVISNVYDDLDGNYDHYLYLDFSDEVIEYLNDNGPNEILEPAIQAIGKRIKAALEE